MYYLKHEQEIKHEAIAECFLSDKTCTTRTASVVNGLKNDSPSELIGEEILKICNV